jgi:RNA-binding protein 5/10
MAFVEFHSIEHSIYSYGCIAQQGLYLDNDILSVQYANQTHMLAMLNKMKIKQTQAGIGMANLALQAAQWATANSTSSQSHYPQQQQQSQIISTPRTKPSFPQSFETHGGSYIFQAPSGYFYEPLSEFYYDPKSKLYYNAIDGVYYKHSLALDPPFYRFDPPIPIGIDNTILEQNNTNVLNLARKPVVMSLGLNKSSKPPVTKKIANDLGKWADRNNYEEEDEEDINTAFKTKNSKSKTIAVASTTIEIHNNTANNKNSITNTTNSKNSISNISPSPSTSSNSTVCLLCKRQFASSEQLLRHEKESKLHKENLIKQLSKNESTVNNTTSYRDRASERRSVHGTSTEPIFNNPINPEYNREQRNNNISNSQNNISSPTPPQSLNTDINNPGNQLLRKMGYSGEGGLGRDQSGIEEAIGVNNNNSNINTKDKSGIGSNNSNCSIDYNNNNYKNSLLNATRQRFENNFNKK